MGFCLMKRSAVTQVYNKYHGKPFAQGVIPYARTKENGRQEFQDVTNIHDIQHTRLAELSENFVFFDRLRRL
jgi:hypothetical protein